MTGWRARIHLDLGDYPAASADCIAVLTDPRAALPSRVTPASVLGRLRARTGEADVWTLLDNALAHARRADEVQRLAPVAAARAEALILAGRSDEVAAETDAVLAAVRPASWAAGELLALRRRAGVEDPLDVAVPEPYALELAGRYAEAAEVWAALQHPYE